VATLTAIDRSEGAGVPRRMIVLGASNVRRGLARLVGALRARTDGPVEFFSAIGHGRSYGAATRVWMRRLPSILGCGLWRALERADRPPLPEFSLLTDIGNDLLYGFPADQVAEWVRLAVVRLTDRGGQVVLTRLPMASLEAVGPVRYRALRAAYVPGCRLSLAQLTCSARELDAHLVGLASAHGVTVLGQSGDWYGLDALHLRRRALDDLWRRVCDAWGLPESSPRHRVSLVDWARLGSGAAEVRMLAGSLRLTPQPVVDRGGVRVWMY
jgi:hypothetical protein